MASGQLNIGTSGWHYKHWIADFYPAKFPPSKMLGWYSQHFDTVEINNSFYKLPTQEALQGWHDTVPKDFCFSVKASRFMTHMKRLSDPGNAIDKFLSRVQVLGNKLGPILFQLPPNWHGNADRLDEFLAVLPTSHRYVFEFRELSWYVPSIYEVLQRHNAALCIHDWRDSQWPVEITANFTYVRLHGSGGTYYGSYSKKKLGQWARKIREWQNLAGGVFVYFNNDQGGHAIRNAQSLKDLLIDRVDDRRDDIFHTDSSSKNVA